jgi:aryl-alcohol dehydrogenase-like predicted oxidoreductase
MAFWYWIGVNFVRLIRNVGLSNVTLEQWQLQNSPQSLPIPGTTSLSYLRENLQAPPIALTPDEIRALDAIAA